MKGNISPLIILKYAQFEILYFDLEVHTACSKSQLKIPWYYIILSNSFLSVIHFYLHITWFLFRI